jgi:hypothetical protein
MRVRACPKEGNCDLGMVRQHQAVSNYAHVKMM